ncbi:TPA: hypothetical protein ACGO4H_001075 [Streptococcus suis]
MTIVEFLWSISSCLIIGLLGYLLYVTIRNDLRHERERQTKRPRT